MKPEPSTNTETAVFGVLMGAWMAASPWVAYAAGRWADAVLSRNAQAQRAALRQVPATLLQPARLRGTSATWMIPDGTLRHGSVSAPVGAEAGSKVMVWVNQAGDLADPPINQTQVADRVELAQGSAAALFAVGLAVIGRQAGRRLSRRRLAA